MPDNGLITDHNGYQFWCDREQVVKPTPDQLVGGLNPTRTTSPGKDARAFSWINLVVASRYWCTFTCPVRTAGLPNQPVQFQQTYPKCTLGCNTLGEPNKTRNVLRELLTNQSKYFWPVPDQWKQEAGFLGRVHNMSN